MTDKEHWNEELLLQFYATLHIRGYNWDPKTWILEWMTGDVHHEAKSHDIIELTSLPTRESWIMGSLGSRLMLHGLD